MGGAHTHPVEILRFRAGDTPMALGVGDVASVTAADGIDAPSIARLLGVEETAGAGARVLRLGGREEAVLRVDGPVEVATIGVDDIIPLSRALPPSFARLILGYAVVGDILIALLSASQLARMVREA